MATDPWELKGQLSQNGSLYVTIQVSDLYLVYTYNRYRYDIDISVCIISLLIQNAWQIC